MLRFLARWTNIHILLNNFDVNFVSCSLLKQTESLKGKICVGIKMLDRLGRRIMISKKRRWQSNLHSFYEWKFRKMYVLPTGNVTI